MSANKRLSSVLFVSLALLGSITEANVVQFSNGNVVMFGSNANDSVSISQNNRGQLTLVISDNNTNPEFHDFDDVTGLFIFTFAGTDTVTVSGNITIEGNVFIDFGTQSSVFQREGTTNMIVEGNFDMDLGSGFNQINFSGFDSSLTVSNNFSIDSAPASSNIMDWSNCIVGGDFEFVGGHGIDTLFSALNGVGLMVDGNLELDMRYDFNGDPTQPDFVNLYDSFCGENLTIKTGLADDQIGVRDTTVIGTTAVQTSNGSDSVRLTSSEFDQLVDVRTGRHGDSVEFISSEFHSSRILLFHGDDVVTFNNCDMGLSTWVDGGTGTDTANTFNSTFGKYTGKQSIENGNF